MENEFATDDINTFIKQTEQRVYNAIQLPAIRKNVTGSVTTGNKYLTCPSDWLATFSMAMISATNEYTYLLDKDVNFIRESFPDTDAAFYGVPQYYAQFDQDSFILGPTPDANYSVELHYYYYPQSIVTANTSWLGDNFDSVLLYGSLLEAYTYMKGENDMMALYNGKYQEAIALAKRLADGMERQDAYRSGQFRQKVT